MVETNVVTNVVTNVDNEVTNVLVTNTNVLTNVNGVSVAWTSSDPDVIATDGTVTRPSHTKGTTEVILTATLSNADGTDMKTFTLTVIALPNPDDPDGPAVRNASDALAIGYNPPDIDSDNVTTNVILPTTIGDGISVSWRSSAPDIIATNGEVTRPSFDSGQNSTDVTLTATLIKGAVSTTKTFVLSVITLSHPNEPDVRNAIDVLAIGYTFPDTERSVTTNVTLPTSADNGVSISWESSDTNIITPDGEVTRPPFVQGTTDVGLTAVLSKGTVTNTRTFILTVIAIPGSDIEILNKEKDALAIGYTSPDTDSSSVTENVTLPRLRDNNVRISWVSSTPGVIAIDGTVIRPSFVQGMTNVTLTATLSKGTIFATKTFILTVMALPDTDGPAVRNASDALVIGYAFPDTDSSSVTTDVTLRTRGGDGVSISWTSSHSVFISINGTNGKVTRPTFAQGTTQVTLTATLSRGIATNTKRFILTVTELANPDIQTVSDASNALMIGYTSPDTSERSVTTNVTLPTSGDGGVSISWMSSNTNVITTDGEVTRPLFAQGTAQVTLTATLSKGAVTNTRSFTLTVVALSDTDTEAVTNAKVALAIGYTFPDTAKSVTTNVALATSGADGVSISWSSSDTSVITANGTVTRPDFDSGNAQVALTATLSKSSSEGSMASDTKVFVLTVISLPPDPNIIAVSNAKEALAITYTSPDTDRMSVTRNLILPISTTNSINISWMSSDNNIIAIDDSSPRTHRPIPDIVIPIIDGIVTRPAFGQRNAQVTLTATLRKGVGTNTKTFILSVIAQPDPDIIAVSNAKSTLAIAYTSPDNSNRVRENLVLPTSQGAGVRVTWSSSDSNIINPNGTVTRPFFAVRKKFKIFLTATLTKGSVSTTKSFTVDVISTINDPNLIDISTVDQLYALNWDPDGNGIPTGSATSKSSYNTAFEGVLREGITYRGYELVTNLDLAGITFEGGSGFWPIQHYNAIFEGNGHTISYLHINRNTWQKVGLFNELEENAEVRRVGLINPSVTGLEFVGALVGKNDRGKITECYVSGGSVRGRSDVGGLVGENYGGHISKSYSTANVPSDVGRTDWRDRVGGFVGNNNSGGTIRACYAINEVKGDEDIGGFVGIQHINSVIEACYSVGKVSGRTDTGGFVGHHNGGGRTITNCYYESGSSGTVHTTTGKETRHNLLEPRGYTKIYATWNDKDVDSDGTVDAPWDFGPPPTYRYLLNNVIRYIGIGYYPALKVDFNRDGIATAAEFGTQLNESDFVWSRR